MSDQASETIQGALTNAFGPKPPKGRLKVLKKKQPEVPVHEEPIEELRRLVKEHKNWTRKAVSIQQMGSDRKNRETGETIPCTVPDHVRVSMMEVGKGLKAEASKLESAMERELRKIPIYQRWLKNVYGCGPVVAAYLISEIDIHRTEKSSGIRKFCGLAVIDGRLDCLRRGEKRSFNAELRTRLYQMFSAMWKNAAKAKGTTTKYLTIWTNVKHREMCKLEIAGAKRNKMGNLEGQGRAHSKGWHKAADIFIEDLYMVWRALEGLPVWPSYYAAKLGYEHGGKISVNAPKHLTPEEAIAHVGEVGAIRGSVPELTTEEEQQAAE